MAVPKKRKYKSWKKHKLNLKFTFLKVIRRDSTNNFFIDFYFSNSNLIKLFII